MRGSFRCVFEAGVGDVGLVYGDAVGFLVRSLSCGWRGMGLGMDDSFKSRDGIAGA